MSDKQGDIIKELREKIDVILQKVTTLKKENESLKTENLKLKEDISANKKKSSLLEEKYNNLKLAKTILSGSEDTHDAKLKVNRIVREIDKCIALLNTSN